MGNKTLLVPISLFPDKNKYTSRGSNAISDGNAPAKLFAAKERAYRLVREPYTEGMVPLN